MNYWQPVIGGLALLLSCYVFLKARTGAKTAATLQYKAQLRQWADAAIDAISETMYLIELDPQKDKPWFFMKRHELMWKMSSLIDRGRLFLHNIYSNKHGLQKAAAFRGFRHPILDWLVLAHHLCRAIDYEDQKENRDLHERFEKCRKEFVSVVQPGVDLMADIMADIKVLGRVLLVGPTDLSPEGNYEDYLGIKKWLQERQEKNARPNGHSEHRRERDRPLWPSNILKWPSPSLKQSQRR